MIKRMVKSIVEMWLAEIETAAPSPRGLRALTKEIEIYRSRVSRLEFVR